jgi:hypothetical protein
MTCSSTLGRVRSPDGQNLVVSSRTKIRRGEVGLPVDGLPETVFELEPIASDVSAAEVFVSGNGVGTAS